MGANERLRAALLDLGMSYTALAEAVGVDAKTVERWVGSGRTPHRSTAFKAARVLREDPLHLWPALQGHRRRGAQSDVLGFYGA